MQSVASAAAAASLFAPRAGGTRGVGRLHVKGTRKLVVTDFQSLDLDDASLDKASLQISNNGTLQFSSGHLIAQNARIGLNGGGTLVVADPNTFFTADLLLVGEDGVLRRYDLTKLKEIRVPHGLEDWPLAVPSPDGRRVAVTSGTMSVTDDMRVHRLGA